MKLEINIKLRAAVRYDTETTGWVSWCPALDLYSQGKTRKRAQDALNEAIGMYVRYCAQKKILDDVLSERGFVPVQRDGETIDVNDDEALEEFIDVRVLPERTQHVPAMFDVTIPLPMVAARTLLRV